MKKGEFTSEDLENAKQTITGAIKFIPDEQDTEITYYFGQVIAKNFVSLEEYENKINKITKEQVTNLANKVKLHTIYFLTNQN